jgi:quinol monooxygenase YgiN
MKYYGFSITFTAQPGKRDELVNILLKSADQLKDNPDCIHYLIGLADEPDAIWIYETWTSKEAHDAALEPEESKALIKQAMPLIAGVSNQVDTQLAGGKGLPSK